MTLHEISRGHSHIVIDVPHAGTYVPPEMAERIAPAVRALPDTDWHVDKLYAFARDLDVTLVVATHSRYVVDLNRDPTGASLYPGADVTELCPTRTFANEPIWRDGAAPHAAEVAARRARYFDPYHAALASEVERIRARHGHALLLDGHSIRSAVPRFFPGTLPDLNLGTANGESCGPEIQALAAGALGAATAFTHVVNGRFKGGYVTRRYGRPKEGVHALQLEIAQACYMDEAPPYPWDATRAAALVTVLERLVAALLQCRPSR